MEIQIVIPDLVAQQLQTKWGNLERKLTEMLVIEAYREGSISIGKVRDLLGIATRWEADAFLQEKGIDLPYDRDELEADRQTHAKLREEGKIASGKVLSCVLELNQSDRALLS